MKHTFLLSFTTLSLVLLFDQLVDKPIKAEETDSVTQILTKETIPNKAVQRITLTSPILARFDGVKDVLDAEKIRGMKYIVQEITRIQYGKLDKATNKRIGCYQFQGQWCSLKKLVNIEEAHEKGYLPLKSVLVIAQNDFEASTKAYLAQAKGAQYLMTQLIKEFCEKRHVTHSILLQWGKSGESEHESFTRTVTTFKVFDQFCTDLVTFLADLQYSCPKGMQQYKEKYGTRA